MKEPVLKYQTLRVTASSLMILTWVVIAIGIISSILLGIRAATMQASITLLLGGFVLTAICALMLLATSKLIHLFLDMKDDLSEIARLTKAKPKS
ncbi:MAG TPA: hypothetical protein VMV84_00540 [Dehalococcoidales bacterium]|nr:hypothetical protein [Dehalococcoidales bacterium]